MPSPTDEQRPLLDGSATTSSTPGQQPSTPSSKAKMSRPWYIKLINPRLTRRRWHLFEILDFFWVLDSIRTRCQAILTSAWTCKIPLLQRQSPAELAAEVIVEALDEIGGESKISVVDFCSGSGGPTPTICRIVNEQRREQGKGAVSFVMSDLHPHLDAWMKACSKAEGGHLSFIPQSVDATDPPVSVTSMSSSHARTADGFRNDTRVFRLYCLSFHHFANPLARKVLKSTMETADGFAIIELQDRYLNSLLLMVGHVPLIFLTSWYRYWKDLLMLILVYVIPLAPIINTWDGLVSCLRTRNFKEVMALIEAEVQPDSVKVERGDTSNPRERRAKKGDWVFKGAYEMHSRPVGYMNWVVGYRKPQADGGQ